MAAYTRVEQKDDLAELGELGGPPRRASLQPLLQPLVLAAGPAHAAVRSLNWAYTGWIVAFVLLVHSVRPPRLYRSPRPC